MDYERFLVFLHSLKGEESPLLLEMEKYAKEEKVPIVRKDTAGLLGALLEIKGPRRVLEVGTAIGYSALFMAGHLSADAKIVTIEKYEKRIKKAREYIGLAGEEKRIQMIEGDAIQVLRDLDSPFDFIFMDAAKGQYLSFLDEIMRLLDTGGVLVSDNVLQEGDILESRYAVRRRDRTIHSRMREYLYRLNHTKGLYTSILPVGDGVALSVKTEDGKET